MLVTSPFTNSLINYYLAHLSLHFAYWRDKSGCLLIFAMYIQEQEYTQQYPVVQSKVKRWQYFVSIPLSIGGDYGREVVILSYHEEVGPCGATWALNLILTVNSVLCKLHIFTLCFCEIRRSTQKFSQPAIHPVFFFFYFEEYLTVCRTGLISRRSLFGTSNG